MRDIERDVQCPIIQNNGKLVEYLDLIEPLDLLTISSFDYEMTKRIAERVVDSTR